VTDRRKRQLIVAATSLVIILVIAWAVSSWITGPRSRMASKIESMRASVERRRADLDRDVELQRQLQAHIAHTLGGSREEVDSALRSSLFGMLEAGGLSEVWVDLGDGRRIEAPGKRDFRGAASKALRDEADFVEIPASVRARGTWSDVVSVLRTLAQQTWAKQVDVIRLAGRGDEDQVDLTVRLRTLFVPDSAPQAPPQPRPVVWPVALTAPSPFLLPTIDVVTESAGGESPSAPSPPGWERWLVTFAGRIGGVDEVHVRDGSGEKRRLLVGQELEGSTYLGNVPDADGFDEARFDREGVVFAVKPGGRLSDRRGISE